MKVLKLIQGMGEVDEVKGVKYAREDDRSLSKLESAKRSQKRKELHRPEEVKFRQVVRDK